MTETAEWLLVKRDLYWRPNGQGYTGIRDHAGRYTFEEAKKRLGDGVTMVKETDAPEFTGSCFEDLARAHLAKQRDSLVVALRNLVRQVVSYEQVNNLAPAPGRKYCWATTEEAMLALKAAGDDKLSEPA